MKRILINATQNEEIRVALCKGNHLYDFDLENRTREQKKSNIYKGHVTRVEPSLEAVFVEYGSQRQGFLPIREISSEYLSGNPRDENIKKLIKEGDELIVQVEKEERGNKGAALSTYVSLAGRYLVLMPNNPRGGGISRQISGKLREDMKRMLSNLDLPKGMSVIIRTAGIGKTQEDLQHDLNHLLNIWQAIQEQNQKYPSPRLVHQEAGVVTRAVRDYLRDDITEIWIDNENAYIEAAGFIDAVMPKQAEKLRKYTDYEPMFSRFNIEKQIETAYQREVRLPSGGSIVIDQTEALVSIDINSAKSTKGSDVAETAYHTNLEAADEIARQLRLRDMGGLIVIDFIDMNDNKNQKEVEKRLIDATKYDRARVQFGEISKFGLMEMSRQRLRPSLEESTGYICPRCHGNGMIRDLRSLSLSIMRQIEQIALKERQGEVQAEVPTDIAAFLLNEKRDALVYLEQDSGTRITILPHAHLESPNFKLHFNRDGFAPSSYERITDTQQQEHSDLGYDVDWQTADSVRPEQQPTRQPRASSSAQNSASNTQKPSAQSNKQTGQSANPHHNSQSTTQDNSTERSNDHRSKNSTVANQQASVQVAPSQQPDNTAAAQPQAVAWLSNLFSQAPQAQTTRSVSSHDAAEAIEAIVNTGAQSRGTFGQVNDQALSGSQDTSNLQADSQNKPQQTRRSDNDHDDESSDDRRRRKTRKSRSSKPRQRKETRDETIDVADSDTNQADSTSDDNAQNNAQNKRQDNRRGSNRNSRHSQNTRQDQSERPDTEQKNADTSNEQTRSKRKSHSQRGSRGTLERAETLTSNETKQDNNSKRSENSKTSSQARRNQDPNEVTLQVNESPVKLKTPEVVHLSLDDSKTKSADKQTATDNDSSNSNQVKGRVEDQTEDQIENKTSSTVATESRTKDNQDESSTVKTEKLPSDTSSTQNEQVTDTLSDESAQDQSKAKTQASAESNAAENSTTVVAPKISETSQTDESILINDQADTATSTLDFGRDELFAARYVTANKFGQASNDPRVVRRQQAQPVMPADTQVADTSTAMPTISGTVGRFIHALLPKAEARLAEDGVINCFIEAIAIHKAKAQPTTDEQSVDASESDHSEPSSTNFDFSNYGYDPLSADYLTRFDTMIQAVSQFAAAQGKTEATPKAIGQRASNDPRGQHPEYQTNTAASSAPVDKPEMDIEEVKTSKRNVAADDIAATALSSQAQADDVTEDSEKLLIADNSAETDEAQNVAEGSKAVRDDAQTSKSKTTIASYKNMIENVAEQLLPQSGMFNLTTPKVPKARSRKPKTDHKKPTQVEQADANSSDNEQLNDSDSTD
ncbi:Rne/Rng family ribonuclease [Psychrobacter sp. DM4]|uniref:Rne/Rng family ribonuclease n=1 Tax=Psychrobacter sp. DM4 TaxID=3440637 RepID=UPI003F4F4CED